jgi:hypothetical protein
MLGTKCNCELHKRERRIDLIIRNGSRRQIRRMVYKVLEDFYMADFDNTVKAEILKGTWTDSVRILEQALVRAREHEKLGK